MPNTLQKEQRELEADGEGPVEIIPTVAEANVRMGPHDFEMLRVVGQGAFGKVTRHSAVQHLAL